MKKRKADLVPDKKAAVPEGLRMARMQPHPVQETEASLRARVKQPIARVLAERPHEWKRAPSIVTPDGLYLSNEGIVQAKALLWPVDGRYRVRLRGLPHEWPDFDTLDEAMAWGRLEVANRLNAGWDPYQPVRQERSTAAP